MVRVVVHDPAWAGMYEHEARRIVQAAGPAAVRVHHIGSTAIAMIPAKPVIDILLEVASLEVLDGHAHRLVALGYEAMGEFGISGRRYFRLDDAGGTRTHQLHAFQAQSPEVLRHVAFRDYLRAHPSIAVEYGGLKQALAQAHPHDMAAYIDGKDAFVKDHERRALVWAAGVSRRTDSL